MQTDKDNLEVQLWDMSRRVLSGDLDVTSHLGLDASFGDGHDVVRAMGGGDVMPVEIPLSASTWFDQLCTAFGGGFTAAERKLLPPGADTADPCR